MGTVYCIPFALATSGIRVFIHQVQSEQVGTPLPTAHGHSQEHFSSAAAVQCHGCMIRNRSLAARFGFWMVPVSFERDIPLVFCARTISPNSTNTFASESSTIRVESHNG